MELFKWGVEHEAHMQVVEEGKIVYNFVGGGNQIGRSPWGGKGFFFFPYANTVVNDVSLGL